ncbi:dihydroxyacetone kinase, L subunit [Acidimicrobium ferrooxidans DSM 10331]|uniref:Dihydroxyacetone kinase, L subunit n=1 Tax=Acidimicrobium ferrooxidans (strain DSM 10331 / JCM 15462 / NBRC 103882 / ICP) TaxID=525909 RepID=C7LYL5_ACIFD|nr:dihydroxyacetone kinase subunit DhaL [Acidimicrobium ferrooxidans]ACU53823.1 dihydroxyacetone kinase, L subunit [Acidimicrobium ferrooxidans DSM 10331]
MSEPGSLAWWHDVWRCFAASVRDQRTWLDDLDAAIGDGDHGTNLNRGLERALGALETSQTPRAGLRSVGMALLGTVGGASGALWGFGWTKASAAAGDGTGAPTPDEVVATLSLFRDAVLERGHAELGDKTMVDVLVPALASLAAELGTQRSFAEAAATAASVASERAESTIPLVARKGRASYLGERSAGHEDPGAASMALFFACLGEVS